MYIRRSDFNTKFKPFLRRLVDDPRLEVSPKGSNIAIMSFDSKAATIRLPFGKHYNKSVYYEKIDDTRSWRERHWWWVEPQLFLALERANKVCEDYNLRYVIVKLIYL